MKGEGAKTEEVAWMEKSKEARTEEGTRKCTVTKS